MLSTALLLLLLLVLLLVLVLVRWLLLLPLRLPLPPLLSAAGSSHPIAPTLPRLHRHTQPHAARRGERSPTRHASRRYQSCNSRGARSARDDRFALPQAFGADSPTTEMQWVQLLAQIEAIAGDAVRIHRCCSTPAFPAAALPPPSPPASSQPAPSCRCPAPPLPPTGLPLSLRPLSSLAACLPLPSTLPCIAADRSASGTTA